MQRIQRMLEKVAQKAAPSVELLLDVLCHGGVGADAVMLHGSYEVPLRQPRRGLCCALLCKEKSLIQQMEDKMKPVGWSV